MQKNNRKKDLANKVAMLLKYWKTTTKEPIMDLCMIIAIYARDIQTGLLYAVGYRTALTTSRFGFEDSHTLSHIALQNKDGDEELVKDMMNGSDRFHAFLLENGTIRVITRDKSTFIALGSDIIAINSGNYCESLFIIDAKMHAYEIKNKTAIRVTGLPNGLKIKNISCSDPFTVFLSECGRVLAIGKNENGALGLARGINKTEIPTEITFSNQNDSNKNNIIITMIYVSGNGWVAVDYKHRAWIIGETLMESVCTDYKSLDPCVSAVELWNINKIRITQIKCGYNYAIALDTEGRVYWFGRFDLVGSLSLVSSDPIPFSHRIVLIRSGAYSVACKDTTNEWYVWGWNTYNHITGLCGCKAVCREIDEYDTISKPMRCEWQGLFDASRVINLQLGLSKTHVIVNSA